jgi:hypothetical protein
MKMRLPAHFLFLPPNLPAIQSLQLMSSVDAADGIHPNLLAIMMARFGACTGSTDARWLESLPLNLEPIHLIAQACQGGIASLLLRIRQEGGC